MIGVLTPPGSIARSDPLPSEATKSVPLAKDPNVCGAKLRPSASSPTLASRVATPLLLTV